MIEMSKSGKSKRFKRVKREDGVEHSSSPQKAENAYLKDTSDVPRSIVIELLKYFDVQSLYNSDSYTQMIKLAQSLNDDIMLMINSNRGSEGGTSQVPTQKTQEAQSPEPATIHDKLDPGSDEIHD